VGKVEGFERAVVGPLAFSSVATLNLKVFDLARSYGEGGMVNMVSRVEWHGIGRGNEAVLDLHHAGIEET
jgi:hypothetical protein